MPSARHACCVDAQLRAMLGQVHESLDVAAGCVRDDPDGALDDILAARLLVGAVLLKLGGADHA